ncbi:MAG: DUF3027 domain-containing protein [Thermomicrobiales bacterium]
MRRPQRENERIVMNMPRPKLASDREHFRACHARWMETRNRTMEEADYPDRWYAEQCGGCQYFVRLAGAFIEDYGACTNQTSPCDGRVMFEHDGCDQFAPADDGW